MLLQAKQKSKKNIDKHKHNVFKDDVEFVVEHAADFVKTIAKEKCSNVEKELKQEQEKTKALEAKNEALETTMRNHATNENKKKKQRIEKNMVQV